MVEIGKKVDLQDVVVKNDYIDAVDIDGEIAMMNIEKGKYYGFNDVASCIWEIMDKPVNVKQIVEKLLNEYDVEEEVCKTTVINFLSDLYSEELILKV